MDTRLNLTDYPPQRRRLEDKVGLLQARPLRVGRLKTEKPVDEGIRLVSFMHYDLGFFFEGAG